MSILCFTVRILLSPQMTVVRSDDAVPIKTCLVCTDRWRGKCHCCTLLCCNWKTKRLRTHVHMNFIYCFVAENSPTQSVQTFQIHSLWRSDLFLKPNSALCIARTLQEERWTLHRESAFCKNKLITSVSPVVVCTSYTEMRLIVLTFPITVTGFVIQIVNIWSSVL